MPAYGSFSDKPCSGIATRAVDWDTTPCARTPVPHHLRHNPVADGAAERLAELGDSTRPASARRGIASAFCHELDAVFTQAARLPRTGLRHLAARYDRMLHDDLVPRLADEGVTFPRWDDLSSLECIQLQHRFRGRTFPLLTPMAVDFTHPLPQLPSLALNVGMRVDGRLVLVTVSPPVPRLLTVRRGRYLTAESFVAALLPQLLVGVCITEYTTFRITRSALTDKPVRMEVELGSSEGLVDMLAARLGVADGDVYRLQSSLAMGDALAIEPSRSGPTRRGRRPVMSASPTETAP